jgi:hypothetical protein
VHSSLSGLFVLESARPDNSDGSTISQCTLCSHQQALIDRKKGSVIYDE